MFLKGEFPVENLLIFSPKIRASVFLLFFMLVSGYVCPAGFRFSFEPEKGIKHPTIIFGEEKLGGGGSRHVKHLIIPKCHLPHGGNFQFL